jgi:2-hydroxychromene-2-carboxylate isomerase
MASPIEFYFDFSSPYGYFASTQIDALAKELGRTIVWRPILLGPMFKAMGSAPLTEIPLKGRYSRHDFERTASLFDIPFTQPDPFPIGTVAAARAVLSLQQQGDHDKAAALCKRLFKAFFAEGRDIGKAERVLEEAEALSIDTQALSAGMAREDIKALLKQQVEDAIARGVFGSPFLFVDDEPFWGFDRFDYIRRWAKREAEAALTR